MGRKGRSSLPGKFLPNTTASQGQVKPTQQHPFIPHKGVDNAVRVARGMTDEMPSKIYVDMEGLQGDLSALITSEKGGDIAQIVTAAVQEALKAAIPAIVQAVKDACVQAVKDKINPHVLSTQFKLDEMDQRLRMDNLRVSGLQEPTGEEEESSEVVAIKVCKVAEAVGVGMSPADISSCHRFGKRPAPGGKARQVFVRFANKRKRDALYDARFKLKGNLDHKGVFINEDLTSMRYALLMAAKKAPLVKGVSSKHGSIVCKMTDNSHMVLRTPDDLFNVGLDDVNYRDFQLHLID